MTRWAIVALVVATACLVGAKVATVHGATESAGLEVALVLGGRPSDGGGEVRAAYEAVLSEEGIPHRFVSATDLVLLSGEELRERYAALVFPDGIARYVPAELEERVRRYVELGGSVAVVFDAGVTDRSGRYLAGGLFAPVLGVEYGLYRDLREGAYASGSVRFRSSAVADRWNVPQGKLANGRVVGGYAYGSLTYPIARARAERGGVEVAAYSEAGDPVISLRRLGKGAALWVGIPLGWLKGRSDDLPVRAVLRTLLLDIVGVPHLVPAPGGVGGLVVSWHIDSNAETIGVPSLIDAGLVRPSLRQEFDVTAGPDLAELGDGLGVDACGAGRQLVRALEPYGEIGSHGGWAHNWFAARLNAGALSSGELEGLIRRNGDCLERITGRPVRSYAAPEGVQPPGATRALVRLGIRAYYYTGDTGSAPNRTFLGGTMVSRAAWAFPVMPNGRFASIGEMRELGGLRPRAVERWLDGLLDYVVAHRTVRLAYSHAYDLLQPGYAQAFGRFLDRVEAAKRAGRLTVRPMPAYADFLTRLLATSSSFERKGDQLLIRLENPSGLAEIAFAVPRRLVATELPLPDGVEELPSGSQERVFVVRAHVTSLGVALPLAVA